MTVYPPVPLLSQLNRVLHSQHSQLSYVGYEGTIFHISGPFAPLLGAQTGVNMLKISGIDAPFKNLDNQGARQDGTTWYDTLYDPAEIDMTVELGGMSAPDMRKLIAAWFGAWDPKQLGKLCWFSPERGEWWANVRMHKPVADQFSNDWYQSKRIKLTWSMRNDNAFWQGVDSVSTYTSGQFLELCNRGDQPGWPRYLCYGPGTFSIGDGSGSSRMITFGPLLAGQVALLNTLPRLPGVVDLSPNQPAQPLDLLQGLLKGLIDFATNNNVPPLLQEFESLFGIVPPQGPLYSLLNGRFTTPLDPMLEQDGPVTSFIPCKITGGNGDSKIIGAVTPLRRWPE